MVQYLHLIVTHFQYNICNNACMWVDSAGHVDLEMLFVLISDRLVFVFIVKDKISRIQS